MVERQKRLKEVYDYLRKTEGIHTQIDFAAAINYSRVYISAAMNGKEDYLTPKLFKSICAIYPCFNLDYLLTGTGTLLLEEEEPQQAPASVSPSEFMDSLKHTNAILENALAGKEREIQRMEEYADRQRQDFDRALHSKDEEITSLKDMIADLRLRLANYESADTMKNFPFSPGVADTQKEQPKNI